MLEMSACVQGEGEGEGEGESAVCYGLQFAAARRATCSAPCALVCGTQRSTALTSTHVYVQDLLVGHLPLGVHLAEEAAKEAAAQVRRGDEAWVARVDQCQWCFKCCTARWRHTHAHTHRHTHMHAHAYAYTNTYTYTSRHAPHKGALRARCGGAAGECAPQAPTPPAPRSIAPTCSTAVTGVQRKWLLPRHSLLLPPSLPSVARCAKRVSKSVWKFIMTVCRMESRNHCGCSMSSMSSPCSGVGMGRGQGLWAPWKPGGLPTFERIR